MEHILPKLTKEKKSLALLVKAWILALAYLLIQEKE